MAENWTESLREAWGVEAVFPEFAEPAAAMDAAEGEDVFSAGFRPPHARMVKGSPGPAMVEFQEAAEAFAGVAWTRGFADSVTGWTTAIGNPQPNSGHCCQKWAPERTPTE